MNLTYNWNRARTTPIEDNGTADRLATVRVIDTAGLFGGIVGFHHLAVTVCRTVDG